MYTHVHVNDSGVKNKYRLRVVGVKQLLNTYTCISITILKNLDHYVIVRIFAHSLFIRN